jgi:hypothetical protein
MMLSHAGAGGDIGSIEHCQASPMATPSICVREGGQIEEKPSISTVHSVVIGTIGTEEASVDGCPSK